MTPELLRELSRLPRFPRTARDLVRVAGFEAAAQLISSWPGQKFPVPAVVGGGNRAGVRRWGQLVEIVGEPIATRIVKWCPGADLYIPALDQVRQSRTHDLVRAEFDRLTATGYSQREAVFELGLKHSMSHAAIETAVNRPFNELGEVAVEAPLQGALF